MKFFLVCDVDQTVALFKNNLALLKLQEHLKSRSFLSQHAAEQLTLFVSLCYGNFILKARSLGYDEEVVQLIEEASRRVENHEGSDIFWSRELWLYAAQGATGVTISAPVAVEAAESYWRAIGDSACLYEDAQEFFASQWWKDSAWELVLVTSSDARLRVAPDGNRLVYDPRYSEQKKWGRIPVSLRQLSSHNGIFVGDPVGKPDPRFWSTVATNIGYDPKEDIAVMVGDSPAVDLVGLPQGFTPILVDRDKVRRLSEVRQAQIIIHGFDSLPFILQGLEHQAKERRSESGR